MIRILPDDAIADLLELEALLPVIEEAFRKQGRGEVERPERPHFPVGRGLDPGRPTEALGTGLTMPAYIHGDDHYVTKLVGVHEGNVERDLPTIHAQIALTEAATGRPAAFMAGTRVTNARTGCIGGLAVEYLAPRPVRLGVIGAGTQARWQTRAIAAAVDIESIRVYSPSDSKHRCAADLEAELGVPTTATATARAAVEDATAVVTATTATDPVFPGDALEPGALVIAIGAYTAETQELDATTFDRAGRVFADVPEEVAGIGDVLNTGLDPDRLVPFAEVFLDGVGRPDPTEVTVVDSVGSAVLDAAAAGHLYNAAVDADAGVALEL